MLFDAIKQEILTQLTRVLKEHYGILAQDVVLEVPPDTSMGDFAFPSFRLAKQMKKAPPTISKELLDHLSKSASFLNQFEMSVLGPYSNFRFKKEQLLQKTLPALLVDVQELGSNKPNQQTVIIEYSSPNIAKPFNIYHLRGTMIGNCLYRVYSTRGYKAISINHYGDWGTQFGALSAAFKMWGNEKDLKEKGIPYLVELYVRFHKESESDPKLEDTAREYFSRLENKDEEITRIWKLFIELSLENFKKTYQRLNVEFDHYWGESKYVEMVADLVKKLKDKKLLEPSEGAQVVQLEAYNMPACIVLKQDGSSIYATRDLAAAIYRKENLSFDKMIYVVGAEQKLHFAQVFKVLELMGYDWFKDCSHVDYGLYRFKDAKMSTRKGNFVTMEAVLDQAVGRVEEIMNAKTSDLSAEEKKQAAEIIGCGAVIFNDLSTDRHHDVQFDLDKVLDFDGETGPYIQYAHTRCLSIIRNAPTEVKKKLEQANPSIRDFGCLSEKEELDLVRVLARLPIVLDQVIELQKPSQLTNYVIDITRVFNVFYRSHKVLVDDEAVVLARLALVSATQKVLQKSLELLGMGVPQRM